MISTSMDHEGAYFLGHHLEPVDKAHEVVQGKVECLMALGFRNISPKYLDHGAEVAVHEHDPMRIRAAKRQLNSTEDELHGAGVDWSGPG